MMLHTSRIIDLLRNKRGRYIHHDAGAFRMKEANGEDVMLTEDRRGYLVEPTAQQADAKGAAKWLTRPALEASERVKKLGLARLLAPERGRTKERVNETSTFLWK